MEDLEKAVGQLNLEDFNSLQYVIDSSPVSEQGRLASTVSERLWNRFERTKLISDFDQAVAFDEYALILNEEQKPSISVGRMNLGVRFYRRFKQNQSLDDLNRAILMTDQAFIIMPSSDPNYASCLSNSSIQLQMRFALSHQLEDLIRAIVVGEKAVGLHSIRGQSSAPPALQLGLRAGNRI